MLLFTKLGRVTLSKSSWLDVDVTQLDSAALVLCPSEMLLVATFLWQNIPPPEGMADVLCVSSARLHARL